MTTELSIANSSPSSKRMVSSEITPMTGVKPQVRRVYRGLLCLMHSSGLTWGSPLPTHEELRRQLHCGSNVLDEAMQLLVEDGVIKRSRGLGTTVRELKRVAAHTWSIAVVAIDEPEYAVKPLMEHYLRRALLECGCADRTYLTKPSVRKIREDLSLGDCVALKEDVESGKIDGIVSLVRIKDSSVPICHVMTQIIAGAYVGLDFKGFVADAGRHLIATGCKRIAMVGSGVQQASDERVVMISKITAQAGLAKPRFYESQPRAWEGQRVVNEIFKLSPTQRPQGLVITDDHVAAGIAAALCSQTEYRPHMAVLANLQSPIPMALPVTRFVLDLRELADMAVASLLDMVLKGPGEKSSRLMRPKLVDIESGV